MQRDAGHLWIEIDTEGEGPIQATGSVRYEATVDLPAAPGGVSVFNRPLPEEGMDDRGGVVATWHAGVSEATVEVTGTADVEAPTDSASLNVDGRTLTIEGTIAGEIPYCASPVLATESTEDGLAVTVTGIRPTTLPCPEVVPTPGEIGYRATLSVDAVPDEVRLVHAVSEWESTLESDSGHCADVNGNGEIDFADVNYFFKNTDSPSKIDPDCYDLNDDGEISLQDVMALFEMA